MRVNETPTFTATTALARYLRVKLTAGKLVAAGAGEDEVGTLDGAALAADAKVAVIPSGEYCVRKVVAATAVAQYANLYRAAGGKLTATANGKRWGIAMEAASGDGSEINAMQIPAEAGDNSASVHTADATLTASQMYGSIFTTVGAAGTVTFSLPAAVVGMEAKFKVGAAQELRIDPNGTETVALPSTGVQGAAGKYLTANAAGETVYLVCDTAGTWSCYGYTGTWTAEG
jgi:hypothetical protein